MPNNLTYLRFRELSERAKAKSATEISVEIVHRKLAERYADRIAVIVAADVMPIAVQVLERRPQS